MQSFLDPVIQDPISQSLDIATRLMATLAQQDLPGQRQTNAAVTARIEIHLLWNKRQLSLSLGAFKPV